MGFKREDIRDTSPLSLKKLNDTIRFIWLKLFGNIDFADLSKSTQGVINNKVSSDNFSSLIEQNPNSVKIAVGQIGGNNLVKNSHGYFGASGWNINATNIYFATDTGNAGIIIYNSGNASTNYYDKTASQGISVKPGIKHTISFYIKGKGENFIFGIKDVSYQTIAGDYTVATNSDQSEVVYSVTFTPNTDSIILQIYLGQYVYGSLLYFYCKLEEGENATAWSPNANELKSNIVEITDDHLRSTFNDGSYAEMNSQGFYNYEGGTGREYHHLAYVGSAIVPSTNDYITIQLPDTWKGKEFYATVALSQVNNWTNGYAVKTFSGDIYSYDRPNGRFVIHGGMEVFNVSAPSINEKIDSQVSFTVIA